MSEVPSRYKQFKLFCNHLAESSKYSELIMSIIVLNSICMAVEHHNEVSSVLDIFDFRMKGLSTIIVPSVIYLTFRLFHTVKTI